MAGGTTFNMVSFNAVRVSNVSVCRLFCVVARIIDLDGFIYLSLQLHIG